MSHEHHLRNKKYRNWVRAGLGLKYLRDGLAPFVNEAVLQQHKDMLSDIQIHYGAYTGCGLCRLPTLMPIHTVDQNGRCSLGHKPICNCKSPRGKKLCQKRFCSAMYDKIIFQHRYASPNWKNTNISQWFTNHWQIAKAFIPAGGYESQVSVLESDCAGLLNIVINNNVFYTLLDTVVDPPNDIFSKTRKARDDIFHSSTLEIEDRDLETYLNDMVAILVDKVKLSERGEAQDAKEKLLQLKSENFVITMYDEAEIRQNAMEAIEEMKQEALVSIDDKQNQVLEEIKSQGVQQKVVYDALEEKVEQIEKKTEDIQRKQVELESAVSHLADSNLQLQKNVQDINKELTNLKTVELFSSVRQKHLERLHYIEEKKALQNDLKEVYQKYYCCIPIHPLMQEEDAKIDELYVQPAMKVTRSSRISNLKSAVSIDSYGEIFCHDRSRYQNIYIVGDAGMGKTSFCKQIIASWCKVKDRQMRVPASMNNIIKLLSIMLTFIATQERPRRNLSQVQLTNTSEVEYLNDFEFLFFISLRHARTDTHLHDMVKNMLLQTERYKTLFDRIVTDDAERCLFILDGLDEWSPVPETEGQLNTKFPDRNLMCKYTVLTTTRPWKLENIKLKNSEVDTLVGLDGVDSASSEEMAVKLIRHLNVEYQRNRDYRDFDREVYENELDSLTHIPVLLQQMVCVWHECMTLGTSQCDIYSSMLNLVIEIATERNSLKPLESCSDGSEAAILPRCFESKMMCYSFQSLIISLSRLAFQTFFSKNRESSLVFPSRQVVIHGLSNDYLSQCLAIGILTESEARGISTVSRYKSLSFMHKTFQEFLAAIYIVNNEESLNVISQSCNTLERINEHSMVFKFVCGMDPLFGTRISGHVQSIVSKERKNVDTGCFEACLCRKVTTPGAEAFCERISQNLTAYFNKHNAVLLEWAKEAKRCGQRNIVFECHDIVNPKLLPYISESHLKSVEMLYKDYPIHKLLRHTDLSKLVNIEAVFICPTVEDWEHIDIIYGLILHSKALETVLIDFSCLRNRVIGRILAEIRTKENICHIGLCGIYLDSEAAQLLSTVLRGAKCLKSLRLVDVSLFAGPVDTSMEGVTQVHVYESDLMRHWSRRYHERKYQHKIDIDLISHGSLRHFHSLRNNLNVRFDVSEITSLCLDEKSALRATSYLRKCRNLRAFTFVGSEEDNMFLHKPILSSLIQEVIPKLARVQNIQLQGIDLRNCKICFNCICAEAISVEFNEVMIEEASLMQMIKTLPGISEVISAADIVVPDSLNNVLIHKFRLVIEGENDYDPVFCGTERISDSSKHVLQQLFTKGCLTRLAIANVDWKITGRGNMIRVFYGRYET